MQEKLIEKERNNVGIPPSRADIFYYKAVCPLGIIFGLADFPQVRLQLTSVQMNELQDLINSTDVWKTTSYAAWIFQWISEIFKIVCPTNWQIIIYKYL